MNDNFGPSWEPLNFFRVGIANKVHQYVWVHGFVEYRKYQTPLRWGELNPRRFDQHYARADFVIYAAVTLFGFVETGIGGIAQSHGEITYAEPFYYTSGSTGVIPAQKRIKLYQMLGINYKIPVIAEFYIPIGFSFDIISGEIRWLPTFRLGLSKRF